MIRFLKYAAIVLLLILVVGFLAVQLVSRTRLNATFEQAVTPLPVATGDAAAISRGDYLVNNLMGCAHSECHRPDLGGGAVVDAPPMGRIYAPNLTGGRGSVTAGYTPEDWSRILRHGLTRSGRRAVVMPSDDYVKFSDTDLGAVVAYIQSRPAIDRDTLPHELGLLAKALVATGQVPFAYDKIDHTAAPPSAAPGPTKEWGAVLIGTCTGCHGPTLAGGPIVGADPSWPPAANITPDQATGIGGWSFADFETAMRRGKRPDGTDIRMPMPWQMYTGMSDQDMRALWEHLRSIPARSEGGT